MILASIAAVREIADDGIAVRLCGGGVLSNGRLDVG
jgi:hypothetical protein